MQDVSRYNNNPNLKGAHAHISFDREMVEEIIKCSTDIGYFIENYVKIVHVDRGFVPFELYPYQRDMINTISKNRHVIMKLPRQSGKCQSFSTNINIRNKQTNKTYTIEIGDFYEWQRFRDTTRPILEEYYLQACKEENKSKF